MRLSVLDVGSNTVHLLVVDAHPGARPTPTTSDKTELRLAERIDASGRLTDEGADALVAAVGHAAVQASAAGCDDLLAFATSALRDATNCDDQPGTVSPSRYAPNAMTSSIVQMPTPITPSQVASRSGAAEKLVMLSTASLTILPSGYLVLPAARSSRM